MPLRRFLSFLALALLATPAIAVGQGTGVIRGRVTDATTGSPLNGVQLSVDGTRLGAQSNSDGIYSISGVPLGAQSITARRVGYSLQRAFRASALRSPSALA